MGGTSVRAEFAERQILDGKWGNGTKEKWPATFEKL
jgi:hypothetical protein